MLEKFIRKDKNEELEKILESKNIEEQAKNLLQGILYKVEVSYKDYKKAKAIKMSQSEYIEEILENVKNNCNEIKVVKLSEKLEDEKIQKELETKKFYIDGNTIITYPIETKLLYTIERMANNRKIVNNKYGMVTKALSNLINIGKSIDRIEVLRDFNGWSWTTIKKEIESIKANLAYQTLQILFGEEFLNSWSKDTDGIIDYIEIMKEELSKKYGDIYAEEFIELLFKISIMNEIELNDSYKADVEKELEEINKKLEKYEDTKKYIENYTIKKKQATKEIKDIEKILSQESKIKEEYEKRNDGVALEKKIFSIRVLKQQLNDRKQQLLNEIEKSNYYLNPENYIYEKNILKRQKELLEIVEYDDNQKEELLIEFEKVFLDCFKIGIEKEEPEKITKQIYQFRYFMLIPFNKNKSIKDVEELKSTVEKIERKLVNIAIEKKVIVKIPKEIMEHVFKTRIITLEELYFKITEELEGHYVQIFDENISEEKFKIDPTEKMKLNKKIKIFI